MIVTTLFTSKICEGELQDSLAVRFSVSGQEVRVLEGDPRFLQLGLPIYSQRYGRLIDFATDGEEWALNLPSAYRNGSISAESESVAATKSEGQEVASAAAAEAVMREYA